MAELADALASGASLSNQVQVQVLFRGPFDRLCYNYPCGYFIHGNQRRLEFVVPPADGFRQKIVRFALNIREENKRVVR